jgi:hypothetical protein
VAEAITAGYDLPLVVTVRNSDDPNSPLLVLAGVAIINASPGEHAAARLTVPARSFARFDEGLSQWVWNPGIYRLHAGRSSRYLRVTPRWCCDEIEASARYGGAVG